MLVPEDKQVGMLQLLYRFHWFSSYFC